ncbi:hypothetical protein PAMP_018779 [Pampus punctatissimus]
MEGGSEVKERKKRVNEMLARWREGGENKKIRGGRGDSGEKSDSSLQGRFSASLIHS